METVTTPGYWTTDAWRGYDARPLPTPERGRLALAGNYAHVIAEGSGEAMLAVARLYAYDERDFMDCIQRHGDPDTWGTLTLRRLTWVAPETRHYRSADERDMSDAARVEYDEDGFAVLRGLR